MVAILAAFTTCDLPLSFGPEYFDTSTNFIAAYPLSTPAPATDLGTIIALDSPAVWDWAWRGKTGDTYEYMRLNDAGTIGGVGANDGGFSLPSTEQAWRLELVNLMPDPDYFEGLPIGPIPPASGWLTAGPPASIDINDPSARGKEIVLVSEGPIWAGFDPSDAFNTPPLPNAIYSFYARTTTGQPFYNIGLAGDDLYTKRSRIIRSDILAIENFMIPSNLYFLKFGREETGVQQNIRIDEVRAVRVDLDESWRLRLLLSPGNTEPGLVPGYYEFSVWVRIPDDALTPEDNAGRAANPAAALAASRIRLAMTQVAFLEGSDTPSTVNDTFSVDNSWTRKALRMEPRSNIDRFDESTNEAVIELSIYPFGTNSEIDVGSVLLAAPTLRFFANGY